MGRRYASRQPRRGRRYRHGASGREGNWRGAGEHYRDLWFFAPASFDYVEVLRAIPYELKDRSGAKTTYGADRYFAPLADDDWSDPNAEPPVDDMETHVAIDDDVACPAAGSECVNSSSIRRAAAGGR